MPYIGARVRRKEDHRLLRGGRFVDSFSLPHMLHAAILRSPRGHARVARCHLEHARLLPGVIGAWAYDDLRHVLQPIPMRLGPYDDIKPLLQLPLAPHEVRYVGEPVAVIVAVTREVAEDACDAVDVVYEPLPAVVRTDDAPPENLARSFRTAWGDPEAAFTQADIVVRSRMYTNRLGAVPLETRGLLAAWDGHSQILTVWGPTKVIHFNRGILARMLHMPEACIRFIEPDVGGGFGSRGEFYPEDFLIPLVAKLLGRPVKWIEDRREHLMASNHSREQTYDVEMAARADGKILAMRCQLTWDLGAYVRTNGFVVPERSAAMLPGPYDVRHYRCDVRCVLTNKTPSGTYRGPGRYESSFVRERLVDMVAERLSMDPADVRRRNLIRADQIPYDPNPEDVDHSYRLDSGDCPALFERALERFGYADACRLQAASPERRLGIGISCFLEKTGRGPWETARVEVDSTGKVVVYSGGASLGQGIETVHAQICADELGVPYEDVIVRHGDTAVIPFGGGSWASRQTTVGGNAVGQAAAEAKRQALTAAARLLEARLEDLQMVQGRIFVRGSSRSVSLAEVAQACRPPHSLGLAATAVYRTEAMSFPFGVHLALVEIDEATGEVRVLRYLVAFDVGRAVNPALVEGQLVGGVAQGVGGVLLEEFVYDDQGQLLSDTFMNYLLPTAAEVPRVDVVIDEVPTPLNPLGIKGAGEGGLTGAAACLANAVADATGEQVEALPLTPERVWLLLSSSRSRISAPTTMPDDKARV